MRLDDNEKLIVLERGVVHFCKRRNESFDFIFEISLIPFGEKDSFEVVASVVEAIDFVIFEIHFVKICSIH